MQKPTDRRITRFIGGHSLDEVAAAVGMDKGDLSRWERRIRKLRPEKIEKLIPFYGATATEDLPPAA